eukprot:CAMPEP_0180545842 /NCGR_PEP_ID=MMETSP1036_2-20121128/70253_1 /TAXON_ID=632150 /ORGANISM="Azadinium spinosum, Strain 3D9" /LENGTH=88 /DNA_ID=CAMNT_0022560907 /DNA_START=999 /DNA_END=1265 /DNA_ORIENTATION=+
MTMVLIKIRTPINISNLPLSNTTAALRLLDSALCKIELDTAEPGVQKFETWTTWPLLVARPVQTVALQDRKAPFADRPGRHCSSEAAT